MADNCTTCSRRVLLDNGTGKILTADDGGQTKPLIQEGFYSGETPAQYSVTFSDVLYCDTGLPDAINDVWTLDQVGGNACQYLYEDDDWYIRLELDYDLGSNTRLYGNKKGTPVGYKYANDAIDVCTISASGIPNLYGIAYCSDSEHGYDGTADWSPVPL